MGGNTESIDGKQGQNIYHCSDGAADSDATQAWYNEMNKPGYDFDSGGYQSQCAQFTQLIWAATRYVGVARSSCGKYIVANYFPAGNSTTPGAVAQNVLRVRADPPAPQLPMKALFGK